MPEEATQFEGTLRRLAAIVGGGIAVASVSASVTVTLTKVSRIDANVDALTAAVAALIDWQAGEVRQKAERAAQAQLVIRLCAQKRLQGNECTEAATQGAVDLLRP